MVVIWLRKMRSGVQIFQSVHRASVKKESFLCFYLTLRMPNVSPRPQSLLRVLPLWLKIDGLPAIHLRKR